MPDSISRGKTPARPGAALKASRIRRGWTLAELSKRTGLPIATLSRAENDKIALTFDKLVRLSEGLQVDIAELISSTSSGAMGAQGGTRRAVARAGEGKAIDMPLGNCLYVAADLLNKKMVPIVGEVFAKDVREYEDFMRHPGEEYLYVLEGSLELHTEIYAPMRLEKGDSVYFDSGMAHAYVALGSKPCRVLSICASSEAHLMGAALERAQVKTAKGQAAHAKRPPRRGSSRSSSK